MISCGWLWLYAGAFLMLGELLAPGFVIFFFGLSAASVGVCRFAFGEAFDMTWQLAAFSAFSIVYLIVLRRWLKSIFAGNVGSQSCGLSDELVGRLARVSEAITPLKPGRVLIGDAEWTATADCEIPVGTDVKVLERANLTVKVVAV